MLNVWRSPFLVLVSLTMVSCGSSKLSQCQNLQTALAETRSIQVAQTADAYLRLGQEITNFKVKLMASESSDPTLKNLQKNLADIYGAMATAAPQISQAAIAKDRQMHDAAVVELQNLAGQEANLIAQINNYCQAT